MGWLAKIRELAMASMIQSMAMDRIARASKAHGQASVKDMNVEIGALVDFYRAPVGKERSGRRGPARIVDLSTIDDGILHLSWQGR
eukprot:4590401-Amphidinium_carterae.1